MEKVIPIFLFSLALLTGCNSSDSDDDDDTYGLPVDIALTASINNNSTRLTYAPDDNNTTYDFAWEVGDAFSVVVPDTEYNDNQKFTASLDGVTSIFDGELVTWWEDDLKTLYAIYPYAESGYTVDDDGKVLFYSTTQIVDAATTDRCETGLMVATVEDAEVITENNYTISDLNFIPVMSLLELSLTDIPSGETITAFGLETENESLVIAAYVDLATATVEPYLYSTDIKAVVQNQSGTTAELNLALLPVNLTGQNVTLTVSTKTATDTKEYTRLIDQELDLESGHFLCNEGSPLSLTDDFSHEEEKTGVLYLADFEDGYVPSSDLWVVGDGWASSEQFVWLTSALSEVGDRQITIYFPYLRNFPNSAFFNEASYATTSLAVVLAPLVESIGENAFNSCTTIEEVNFPLAIDIEARAFYNATALSTVECPAVDTIRSYAFTGCSALSELDLAAVESIGEYAFSDCVSLVSLEFPSLLTTEYQSFNNCSSLTSVSSPTATTIGNLSFRQCYALTSANFPSVTKIGYRAFYYCYNLSDIEFPDAIRIGEDAFMNCSALTVADFPLVDTIGNFAFSGCTALAVADFPSATLMGITWEGASFASCESLSTINFPLVDTVYNNAFYGCTSLESVELPSALVVYGSAFSGCESLSSATLPKAKYLGSSLFYNCPSLETLTVATSGNTINTLGYLIFNTEEEESREGEVTLNIGEANSDNIDGNTLTVDLQSYTFKEINLE